MLIGVSFLTLEFGLGEVLDPCFTALPLIAPSVPGTLRDKTAFIITFLDPPFPLPKSTEFEVWWTFDIDASVNEDNKCYESGDIFIEVHDLDETLVGRSIMDVLVIVSPSSILVDLCILNSLDISHAFPSCSLPFPSYVIYHLLILMLCLRGMRLTALSPYVLLKGMTHPLIVIICT